MPILTLNLIWWSVLSLFVIFYIYYYKKNKIKVLTIRKLSIMGLFFSIFVINSLIGRYLGGILLVLDATMILLTSVLFGPLEGIIFALIADTTRAFIIAPVYGGWLGYYAVVYPLLAAFGGTSAIIYSKTKDKVKPIISFSIFNIITIAIIASGFSMLYFSSYSNWIDNEYAAWQIVIISSTILLFIEIVMGIYFYKKKNDKIWLITLIYAAMVISRMTIYVGPDIGDAFIWGNGWESYPVNLITSVYRTTYIIPTSLLIFSAILLPFEKVISSSFDKQKFGIII